MPHKDPEVRRAYLLAYKRRFRWKYAERQRALDSARHANERAEKYQVEGQITTDEVFDLLHDTSCHYCGELGFWMGLDHVVPMSEGGPNTLDNIVACCHSCNASKYQSDRPGRWSRHRDQCIECGTSERPHACHGRCSRCQSRHASRKRRALRSAPQGVTPQ